MILAEPHIALPPKWWEAFDVDDEESIWEVCQTLLSCYEAWGVNAIAHMRKPVQTTDSNNNDYMPKDIWRQAALKSLPLTKSELRRWLEKRS